MPKRAKHSFYKEVVNITYEYLGPAADRFVARQVRNHLSKDAELLQKQDLATLIDWISLAMAVLVEDDKVINQYIHDLQGLLKPTRKQSNTRQIA